MSFKRVILVALATFFSIGMTSACVGLLRHLGLCRSGRLCARRLRRRLRRLRIADGGRGLCRTGGANAAGNGADLCQSGDADGLRWSVLRL